MRVPQPFFLHRWVEQDPLRNRRFNNTVYLLIALGFVLISGRFILVFELGGTPQFEPPLILLFFALLAFSNLATVSAAYPHPDNRSFYAETQWGVQALVLYPWACWLALASSVIMLAGALAYTGADGAAGQHAAAQAWAAGLLLSAPALAYRTLFSRPLG